MKEKTPTQQLEYLNEMVDKLSKQNITHEHAIKKLNSIINSLQKQVHRNMQNNKRTNQDIQNMVTKK
jgi:prefoldin subunit 5